MKLLEEEQTGRRRENDKQNASKLVFPELCAFSQGHDMT